MHNNSPGRLERFLLIALLASLAIAQPLFSLLGTQAEFLVAHRFTALGLTAFALLLGLAIPVVLALVPILANRIGTAFGSLVFGLFFVLLAALTLMPLAISAGLQGASAVAIALLASLALMLLYWKVSVLRLFFRFLTPAVLVFPLAFLFFSRASPLLLSRWDISADGLVTLQSKPDIIFLVLDEFPLVSLLTSDLEIDHQRFPNFARLADQSNWYLAATTGAVVTVDAVPEALTGMEAVPGTEKLPIAAHFPRNLFTLLQGGYDMTVMETATRLCPREVCTTQESATQPRQAPRRLVNDLALIYAHIVTPLPWAQRLPSISDAWSGFNTGQAVIASQDPGLAEALGVADLSSQMKWNSRSARFRNFIDRIQTGERPGLFYFHSLLPHRVWRYLPDGRQYLLDEVWAALDPPHSRPGADGKVFGHAWQDDELAVNMALQRHILQVQFTDRLLGELLDHLEYQDMLDDSLLIVIGDHGASFMPGQPRRVVTMKSLTDISAIPLFIKLPKQVEADRIISPAALMDILPTIVDALGIAVDWPFTGTSLIDSNRKPRKTVTIKNAHGAAFDYPVEQHLAHLAQRAAGHEEIFGRGTGPGFYSIGPNAELIGTRPEAYKLSVSSTVRLSIDAADLYRDVDPAADFVPLHLSGILTGTLAGDTPLDLAFIVNGIIRATGRTYDIKGFEDQFAVLLPPETLIEGENIVQVYQLDSSAGELRLVALQQADLPVYRMATRGRQRLIIDANGKQFTVQSGVTTGEVVSIEDEGAALHKLQGSVPTGALAIPRIVVFKDGQFAGSSNAVEGVFNIPIRSGTQTGVDTSVLELYVLSETAAVELNYPEPCSPYWKFAAPANWQGIDCVATAKNPLRWQDGVYRAILNFGQMDIRQYMGRGWDFHAGEVSWATGQQADLEFPLPDQLQGLKFKAMVHPFLAPPTLDHQDIYVLANGENIGSWKLDQSGFTAIEWQVSAQLLQKGGQTLHLSFLMPDAASPKSLDAGEDLRILGLAFRSIEIIAATEMKPPE